MLNFINSVKKNIFKAKTFLYLAIFFLPVERVLIINISDTNVRFSHLFLLISILIWIWNKIIDFDSKNKKIKDELKNFLKDFVALSNLHKLMIVYFVVLAFSLISAQNSIRPLQVFWYTVFVLSSVFFIPHYFYKIKEVAIKELRSAIKVFLAGTLVFCFFGLFQFIADMAGASISFTFLTEKYTKAILGFTRIQGFFIEPLYFANFLIFPIVFCILLLTNRVKKLKTKIFLWATLALSIINFILTNARGAFISLIFVLIVLLILNRKKFSREFYISCISAIVLIMILLGLIYFVAPQSKMSQFVLHAANPFSGAAFEERKETFGFAWQMFQEKPIIGHGPGSFGLQAPLKEWEVRENWKIVNNLYLELLAESGILGFLSMIIFFILLLYYLFSAWRKTEDKLLKILLQGFFLVILGILIQYNTFSIIYLPYVWITIGLAAAALKISDFNESQ